MEVTTKVLEERIGKLQAQKEQAVAQVNALNGAIITLRDLRKELDRKEPRPKKSKKPRKGKK